MIILIGKQDFIDGICNKLYKKQKVEHMFLSYNPTQLEEFYSMQNLSVKTKINEVCKEFLISTLVEVGLISKKEDWNPQTICYDNRAKTFNPFKFLITFLFASEDEGQYLIDFEELKKQIWNRVFKNKHCEFQ